MTSNVMVRSLTSLPQPGVHSPFFQGSITRPNLWRQSIHTHIHMSIKLAEALCLISHTYTCMHTYTHMHIHSLNAFPRILPMHHECLWLDNRLVIPVIHYETNKFILATSHYTMSVFQATYHTCLTTFGGTDSP